MATVHIVLGKQLEGSRAGIAGLAASEPEDTDTLASSAASQTAGIAVPSGDDGRRFWSVVAMGGPVWLSFGTAPVAAAESGWLLLDGERLEFAARGGDTVAVIDA